MIKYTIVLWLLFPNALPQRTYYTGGGCSPEDLRCRNGSCVSYMKRCDLIQDCPEGEDELDCHCNYTQFRCDGKCLPLSIRCNSITECLDRTDELNCPERCKELEWQCADGKCISSSLRCDMQTDCLDKSDEQNCTTCPDDWFKCNNKHCIPPRLRCNGISNCNDMSDELGCVSGCPDDQFSCGERCIHKSQVCNNYTDCADGRDEHNCQRACQTSEFRCRDGTCIPSQNTCDGNNDCSDNSDEDICSFGDCLPNEFRCKNGVCISREYVCDGLTDCTDKSDEEGCADRPCAPHDFRCGDNKCISPDQKCDGQVHCYDGSDEDKDMCRPACQSDEWQCNNGDCISLEKVCNGKPDCSDISDETNTDCKVSSTAAPDVICNHWEFPCWTRKHCIRRELQCNGIQDCPDNSDEEYCAPTTTYQPYIPTTVRRRCSSWEFSCRRNGECIPIEQQCDNKVDCSDGSDEELCAPSTTYQTFIAPTVQRHCSSWEFRCWGNGECIPKEEHCDNKFDCPDGSDEDNCAGIPLPNLKVYERDQIIKEKSTIGREAVFRCRDEGPGRYKVKWSREGGHPLPPGSRTIEGRLEMPNVQIEHSGVYYCEAIGVPSSTSGARVPAHLTVEQLIFPTQPYHPACGPNQATCYNRDCIDKSKVCNGKYDCGDGSDETRCENAHLCEPNEFRCNNRRCVLKSWRCDSDDDCGDNSDELGCEVRRPGSQCFETEFECKSRDQCIPRSFHCDGTNDCQDRSDEEGCRSITITTNPDAEKYVVPGGSLVLTCAADGIPTPEITWRKDWRHVPAKCTQTSINGVGTLTCPHFQREDCGAYTCEAVNSITYVISQRDTIVCVNETQPQPCPRGQFMVLSGECVPCFCFGIVSSCRTADLYMYQLPPPIDSFSLVNVYITPSRIDVRRNENSYLLNTLQRTTDGFSIQSSPQSYDYVYPYYALPEKYHGSQLNSYGGYLTYTVQTEMRRGQLTSIPDIIITGNNQTLIYRHPHRLEDNFPTKIAARFYVNGNWYIVKSYGEQYATREDIMMTLVNVDNILIRTQYTDGQGVTTSLSGITLDSAQYVDTGLGRAGYVEQCDCPTGYRGLSCETCSEKFIRTNPPPWLGHCITKPETCPRGYFGDPSRRIPCEKCPCPHSSPPNQFTEDCYLDTDNLPTCRKCPIGHRGRRCEYCLPGYVGDPLIPGSRCTPEMPVECDRVGSSNRYPPCHCKGNAYGPLCSECVSNTFHFSPSNQDLCTNCFCMGITKNCSSSRLYRDQIVAIFARDNQNFSLAPEKEYQNLVQTRIDQNAIIYDNFEPKVYYWILPQKFLGNRLASYGGTLTYTLRYVSTPGGLSSRNNAADVKLFSRNQNLYYYRNVTVEPDREQTISVELVEKNWQREDGGTTDREFLLMALADLDAIYIKATYTTTTQFASLQRVSLETGTEQVTGRNLAVEVEECRCPAGYKGLSCESCDTGYKRANEGFYLGLCEICDCNGRSEECNSTTGECYNCRENWEGPNCNICRYKEIGGRCEPPDNTCEACNRHGTHSCSEGRCKCKVNIEGTYCDQCREGTFNLSSENLLGCSDCYCSYVSKSCHSSNLYYEPIPMQILDATTSNGFVLTDRDGKVLVRDNFILNPSRNEIGYNVNRDQERLFWSLPPQFTGDKVTSYGGNLIFKRRFSFDRYAYIDSDYDVVLHGNGKAVYWQNLDYPRSNRSELVEVVKVPLEAGRWRNKDPSTGHSYASRADILEILSQLSSVLIRASAGPDTLNSYLSDVELDVAIRKSSGRRRAYGVEDCTCPPNFTGSSCQGCIDHYYRDFDTCKKCPCSNSEDSCSLGSNNEVHCVCRPGFYGKRCEINKNMLVIRLYPGGNITPPQGKIVPFFCYYKYWERAYAVIEREYLHPVTFSYKQQSSVISCEGQVEDHILIDSNLKKVSCKVYNADRNTLLGISYAIVCGQDTTPTNSTVPAPTITVTIHDTEPNIYIKEVGSTVRYRCYGTSRNDGASRLQVRWSKKGGDLPRRAYDDNQGILEIVNLKVSDTGTYVCTIYDGISSESQFVTLNVGDRPLAPEVQISPTRIEAYEREAIDIYCQGRGSPLPSLEWRRLDNGTFNPQVDIRDGHLHIPHVTRNDAGYYECIGRNSAGSVATTIKVTIHTGPSPPPGPSVYINPPRISASNGEQVILECVGGDPFDNEIDWRRDDGRPYSAQKEDSRLIFRSARPEDTGVYICTIRSRTNGRHIGTSHASISISDFGPRPYYPHISPEQQRVPQGHTAEFTCNVGHDSFTPYNVKWYKADGRIIPSRAMYLNNGRTLRLPDLAMEDRGIYVCFSVYGGRAYNISASLEVDRRERPRIQLFPVDRRQILSVGNTLMLHCRVEGYPAPLIQWSRADNNPLPSHFVSSINGVLRMNQVSLSDAGQYICTAENEVGKETAVANIEVQSPPVIRVFPKDTLYLVAGENLDLTCVAEGTPKPTVQWTRRDPYDTNQQRSENEVTAQANYGHAEYQVFKVSREDNGVYWCVAQNEARREVKSVQVYVDDYRTPPPDVSDENFWVPTGGDSQVFCEIDGYRQLERQWVRADRTPFPSGVSQQDGVLYIRGATRAVQGEYICQLLDEHQNVQRRIGKFISIKELPVIMLHPPRQIVRPGDDAEIRCTAQGEEPIDITWEAARPFPLSVTVSGGLLTFKGIAEGDAGRYICKARNIAGLREAAADVIVDDNFEGRPRVSVIGDRTRATIQGSSISLQCSSEYPNKIGWSRNEGPLPSSSIVEGDILRIMDIQPHHSGRYTCSVRSPTGGATSDYVDITVTRERTCSGGFQCRSGECIHESQRCDYISHCADNSDELYCPRIRRGAIHIRLKIEPSIDIIRVGSTVDLRCITEGIPSSKIEWTKLGEDGLGPNVQIISASVLRILDVTTSNAGPYRCSAQTESGTYTDDYTLSVQDNVSLSDSPETAAKTIVLKVGDTADISCTNDLEPPVSYKWLRQGGLPLSAQVVEGKLTVSQVRSKDAGLYTCEATNGEVKMEIPTFVVVQGSIPRFNSQSLIKLKTLFEAYLQFDIEILFKPEEPNGLILYNGRQPSSAGGSDFVSFGLRNGYPEFRFDMGSGHSVIVGRSPLAMGMWAKAKLNRDRKEGQLVINDEDPVIGTSQGRHQGLDLDLPLYLGSVPNFSEISKSAEFNTGFKGCISRLVIKNEEQNLTETGVLDWSGVEGCDTCVENKCTNSGACQEAANIKGYVCLCPKGFSGEHCDRTGESCYPGLCGDGYCENTQRGYVCKCPLGLIGSNCEHRIKIRTPSFEESSYIAYSAPRDNGKIDITLKLNPSDSRDALILYAAQNDFGTGNYISITIKDRRLEFRVDTGSGSPMVLKSNSEIVPGSWMTVNAGRDNREGKLSIGHDVARTTLTSGQRKELLLGTFLYLGGFDTSTGSVNPSVGVADGFRGCISHIEISRMDLDILRNAKESSNVGECASGNPCRDGPCRNGASCVPDGPRYTCHCTPDYTGLNCEKLKNDCERYDPCGKKGDCIPLPHGYKCHCTKGFSGQNCTIREHITMSFSMEGDGWAELPKEMLEGDDMEMELNIVTDATDGILVWHGQGPTTSNGNTDFFSVAVVNGFVEVVFELGSGLGRVVSDSRVNDGQPHRLLVTRSGSFATLTVDGRTTEGQSDGILSSLNANGNIYIGGVPDPRYMTNGRYLENFNGCIRNIRIQNSDVIDVSNSAISTVNLRRCPVTKWIPSSTRAVFTDSGPTVPGEWPHLEKSCSSSHLEINYFLYIFLLIAFIQRIQYHFS